MALSQKIANSFTRTIRTNISKLLSERLSEKLSERYELEKEDVEQFLEEFFETELSKKPIRKGKRNAYQIFQRQKRKEYADMLIENGTIDSNMDPKEKMRITSRYVADRWYSVKNKHQDEFEEYKKIADNINKELEEQQQASSSITEMPPPSTSNIDKKEKQKNQSKQALRQRVFQSCMKNFVETGYWTEDDLINNLETILRMYTPSLDWKEYMLKIQRHYFQEDEEDAVDNDTSECSITY